MIKKLGLLENFQPQVKQVDDILSELETVRSNVGDVVKVLERFNKKIRERLEAGEDEQFNLLSQNLNIAISALQRIVNA